MSEKATALADLRTVFNQWKDLVSRMREPELTAAPDGDLSVKDVLAHLHAWQGLSVARLEAARAGGEPVMPGWVAGSDPDTDDDDETDALNARIAGLYRRRSWTEVHRAWRDGFLRLLALAEAIPDDALTERGRYPWLGDHALLDVLRGTCEHHREHLAGLM